jgi:GNAT superfamily N-acetyltransferase
MEVKLADSNSNIQGIAAVLQQLRTQFPVAYIKTQIREQMEDGYNIAYIEEDGEIVCVGGFVIGQKLAWGKYLYIDDLVTNEYARSKSAGAVMVKWLKEHAKSNGCQQLHIDSGVQRYMAHKFYLREGFIIASHHFSMSPL